MTKPAPDLDKVDATIASLRRLKYLPQDGQVAALVDIVESLATQLRATIDELNNHRHGYRWEKFS